MRLPTLLCCLGLALASAMAVLPAKPAYAETGVQPADRTTLRVAIRVAPPFVFLDKEEGELVYRGYAIDQWKMLGEILDVDIAFTLIDMMDLGTMLRDGRIDASLTVEEHARLLQVTFIDAGLAVRHRNYAYEPSSEAIAKGWMSGMRAVTIKELRNAPLRQSHLGVEQGPRHKPKTLYVDSPLEALEMLDQGVFDIFIAPSEVVADYLIERYGFDDVVKVGDVLGEARVGLVVSPDKPELAARLRAAQDALQSSGNRAEMQDKWFVDLETSRKVKAVTRAVAYGLGSLLVLFCAILVWNWTLKRKVRRTTNTLRKTEQQYRELIESSPDMIFLVDRQGHILHANARAKSCRSFPRSPEKGTLADLVSPDEGEKQLSLLESIFELGSGRGEFVITDSDNQPQDVEIAGCIIEGPLHQAPLACLFARNITERNRLEEELIQSERLAIIGKMAASVAHEVNNPLGIIRAGVYELKQLYTSGPDDLHKRLAALERNAQRAGEITTGLLEAASPKPVAMEVLDVEALIAEALALLGPRSKGRPIEVRVQNGPLFLRGDSRILQQVLINLLFNAQAAMEGREPKAPITILAYSDSAPGIEDTGTIRVVVCDTGTGIPRGSLLSIFEPFFTSRQGGFGLGLFIARRMVERHGGLVFAESDPGRGTSIFVELPAHSDT